MKTTLKYGFAMTGVLIAAAASAQVTLYEYEEFDGQSIVTKENIRNLRHEDFNDRASSAVVFRGRWAVCEEAAFRGHCVVLRPGRYASLSEMGLNNSISSVRRVRRDEWVEDFRYAPAPAVGYEYGRRPTERLYEARVTSVRAVVGPREERCWIEREQVAPERRSANVPGAIAGAVIGGILGHQVGSGRGQDIATAGGAVAGAAIGANVGREGGQPGDTREVQRCAEVPGKVRPNYWDVTYDFRGQEHRVQMAAPPRRSITVNQYGEPRE